RWTSKRASKREQYNTNSCSPQWDSEERDGNGAQNVELVVDLKHILTTLNNVVESLKALTKVVEEMRAENRDTKHRLNEGEQRIDILEKELEKEKKHNAALDSKFTALAQRLDDQENRARRNNLRILGFPEQREKGKPLQFLQEVLPKLLGLTDGTQLEVERAHHTLGPRPEAGQQPRPFIVKFLRFQDKKRIIRKVRERGTLEWEGNKILIFPDLSKELQEKRRRILDVKKTAEGKRSEIRTLLSSYPQDLSGGGKDYAFTDPKEAQTFWTR
uniref:L1 transposable element RRM domain-containing protein n=1 Tax=Latimeria chalumnae TaxID=7897 RepID=H2ZY25_LATCH